jgi:hypothetical protein
VRKIFYDYPSISQIDEELAARQIVKITVDELNRSRFTPFEASIMKFVLGNPTLNSISPLDFGDVFTADDATAGLEALVQKRFLTRSATSDLAYSPRGYTALAQSLRLTDYRVLHLSPP